MKLEELKTIEQLSQFLDGTPPMSTLVKKLCSYKKHNSTTLALAEYNRQLKCLYFLDYVDDKQLRH